MPSEIRIWTLRSDVNAIDGRAAASAAHYGDVVEIKSCIVLKLGSSLRTIASWTASAVSSPRLFASATGEATDVNSQLTPDSPLQSWLWECCFRSF